MDSLPSYFVVILAVAFSSLCDPPSATLWVIVFQRGIAPSVVKDGHFGMVCIKGQGVRPSNTCQNEFGTVPHSSTILNA